MSKIIAIIDDELEMEYIYALMLEEAIQEKLLELKFFSDARVFFEWLIDNKPDLILSDISMPYISGLELGRRIRQSGRNIPIYYVSGHEEYDFQEVIAELGSCHYLSKPLNCKHFISLIKTDLGL